MGKQKRSENTYQKINTIFKRDANNVIMPYNEFALPELEWLRDCKFDAEEKAQKKVIVRPSLCFSCQIL